MKGLDPHSILITVVFFSGLSLSFQVLVDLMTTKRINRTKKKKKSIEIFLVCAHGTDEYQ